MENCSKDGGWNRTDERGRASEQHASHGRAMRRGGYLLLMQQRLLPFLFMLVARLGLVTPTQEALPPQAPGCSYTHQKPALLRAGYAPLHPALHQSTATCAIERLQNPQSKIAPRPRGDRPVSFWIRDLRLGICVHR